MLRFHCAIYSDFSVRFAPFYAQLRLHAEHEIYIMCVLAKNTYEMQAPLLHH